MAVKEVNTESVDFERALEIATKLLQDILENPDKCLKLQFLVCGQTGVGKSSLVNALLGYEVCPTGGPGDTERSVDDFEGLCKAFDRGRCNSKAFEPETKEMTKIEVNINGTIVTIWDSPGLLDGSVNVEQYLQKMYDCCHDVDLVFYCVEMTDVRWTPADKKAITQLTEKFGNTFWEKCVLVLTKANMIHVPRQYRLNKHAYHERLYHNFIHQLQLQLYEQKVPQEVCSSLTAVAAGIVEGDYDKDDEEAFNNRYLLYVSERRKSSEREDFIAELWVTVFEVLKRDDHAQAKLINITDSSRMTITEDAQKSNCTVVKLLQHKEGMDQITKLASAPDVSGALCIEPKQHREVPINITEKVEEVQKIFEGISQPQKKEGSDFTLDSKHVKRVKLASKALILCAGAGSVIGGVAGIIGGPLGMLIGAAVGAAVGTSAGAVLIKKMLKLSILTVVKKK